MAVTATVSASETGNESERETEPPLTETEPETRTETKRNALLPATHHQVVRAVRVHHMHYYYSNLKRCFAPHQRRACTAPPAAGGGHAAVCIRTMATTKLAFFKDPKRPWVLDIGP